MADVNPSSWRYTSILLLPGTRCYERFTDDTIDNTRKVIIDGIAGLGLTPRGKSRFQLVTDAFTNPGSFASKIASDKKSGLERKKQEVAEWKAEEAEKKKKAAEKEKKKARKRGKAKPVEKKKEIPEEDRELEEVKRDPAGVKAALSHMADDDGGGGGGGGGTSGSESDNDSNNSLKTLDLTEQEGAADVIYILAGDVPPAVSEMESLLSHGGLGGKPGMVDSSLLHMIVELSSFRPVRAGLFSPSQKLKEAAKENFNKWKDIAFIDLKVDTTTEKLRSAAEIAKDLLRMVADTAVDRYLYDEWLKAATIIKVMKKNDAIVKKSKLANQHYDNIIQNLREDCGGISLAVHCMAEAVARANCGDENDTSIERWNEFDAFHKNNLQQQQQNSKDKEGKKAEKTSVSSVLLVVEDGDTTLRDIASAPGKKVLEEKIGSEKIVDIATRLGTLLRVPGGMGRAGMPRRPQYSDDRRGMDRTELLTFTSIPTETIERVQNMVMFENMLKEIDPVNTKVWIDSGAFYKRNFRERILPQTISQIVGDATTKARREDVVTKYDPAMDRLLVAVHTPTAPGRSRQEKFDTQSSGCCSVKPGFRRWVDSRKASLEQKMARAQKKYAELEDKFRTGDMTEKQVKRQQQKIAAKTARTVALTAPILYDMEQALIELVEDETTSLFPADNGMIRIYKYKTKKGDGYKVWPTVEKDSTQFGLRAIENVEIAHNGATLKKPSKGDDGKDKEDIKQFKSLFVANFLDGSRAVVDQGRHFPLKPDGNGTVRVTITGKQGLAVEIGTDGSVCQRYVSNSIRRPKAAFNEVCRSIIPGGIVVRYLKDGAVQILYPNGATSYYHKEGEYQGKWEVIVPNGYRFLRDPIKVAKAKKKEMEAGDDFKPQSKLSKAYIDKARELLEELPRISIKSFTDPISLAKIVQREDGVTMITYRDGSLLTTHADKTVILRQEGSGGEEDAGFVTISAPGFTKVELDIDVDENASRHANGLRIALSKGGMQKRVGCVLADGTIIEAMYNTKFTATVNGSLEVSKPDGTKIIATDDGKVEFRPASLAPADGGAAMEARKFAPDGSKVLSEALSEPDTTSGAYFADCYTGILTTSDQENNIFTINLDGTYDLDLAGEDVEDVTTPAIVNQPIEPRLFVLDGDGYGYEYLRPSDVDEYLRKIELDCTGTISRLNPSVAIEKGFSREKKGTEAPSSSTVHTYMYDVLKRSVELSKPNCMDRPPSPDKPHVIKQDPKASLRDREVIVVRNLEEMKPLEIELRDAVLNAERDCAQWRDDREANQNRFAVDDTREKNAIDAEKDMATMILKLREKPEDKVKKKKKSRSRRKRRSSGGSSMSQVSDSQSNILNSNSSVNGQQQQGKLSPNSEMNTSQILEGKGSEEEKMDGNILDGGGSSVINEEEVNESMTRSKRIANKDTDPTRDTGGFWKSMEGVQASQSISKTFNESLTFGDDEGDEEDDEDLESWQLKQSTMHGTRPNVLATAEKELQNGAEIIPRNKQIDVTNKIPVPDEDIIPKVSLKPLRSNQTQAAKNPVGSASQVAKTRQMQKNQQQEEEYLQEDFQRLQNLGEEMAREIAESKMMMDGGSKEDSNSNLVRLNRYTAEDTPVRRKIKTSSSVFQDKVVRSRGSGGPSGYLPAEVMQNAAKFVVTPSNINMGRLCEGCRYKIVASVKNTGSDTSRFRLTRRNQKNRGDNSKFDGGADSTIHQLRVVYRAGPLAAGMHARLELEIKAKGVGVVEDHFEIVTEHQILKIPVTCEIVTPLAHDPRHVSSGVKHVGYIDK